MEFSYMMPTKIFFGNGCVTTHRSFWDELGSKALIVTGKKSAKITGALDDICEALEKCGTQWEVFDRVEPNPSIENVREGAKAAVNAGADFIVGIGGGSPIDAAKAIAVLSTNDMDNESLFVSSLKNEPLPVVAVPTTAGTGSEVTQYSILTDNKAKTKKNLSSESLFPVAAFLDPIYTKNLPHDITVNTAIDALCHSVESYLSRRSSEISSLIALRSLELLGPCLCLLDKSRNLDMDTREKLLLGSMLGGIAIAQTGTTVVHAMGYSLTFFHNIDHGKANGMLLSSFLDHVKNENIVKIGKMLQTMGFDEIKELEDILIKLLGKDRFLSMDQIRTYAEMAVAAKSVPNTVPEPSYDDIVSMFGKSVGNI